MREGSSRVTETSHMIGGLACLQRIAGGGGEVLLCKYWYCIAKDCLNEFLLGSLQIMGVL